MEIIRYCLGGKEVEDLGDRRDEGPLQDGGEHSGGAEGEATWEVFSSGERIKGFDVQGVSESL